jgi:hypothetical protein
MHGRPSPADPQTLIAKRSSAVEKAMQMKIQKVRFVLLSVWKREGGESIISRFIPLITKADMNFPKKLVQTYKRPKL